MELFCWSNPFLLANLFVLEEEKLEKTSIYTPFGVQILVLARRLCATAKPPVSLF